MAAINRIARIATGISFVVVATTFARVAYSTAESSVEAVSQQRTDRVEFARHRLLETALRQASEISGYWDPGQRDCAGLVRFIFREAVAGPAEIWRNRQGQLTAFVSASELVAYNFTKISDLPHVSGKLEGKLGGNLGGAGGTLETGDILVYHRPGRRPEDTWHVMVLLKPPSGVRQEWLAIYHNGVAGPAGQVRIVSLKDLSSTVHSEWRPTGENLSFKGVYRWNQWVK